MKRKRLLKLLSLFLMALTSSSLVEAGSISYTTSYFGSMVVSTDTLGGVTYSTVAFGGLYNGGEPGKPSLPIDYITFSVPYNATNFSVTVGASQSMTQSIGNLIYPCQMPVPTDGNKVPPITPPDSSVYYSGSYYPSQKAWIVDEGILAGENHIVTVAVMPIAFRHTTNNNQLRLSLSFSVTLNYDISNAEFMSPIVSIDNAQRNEGFHLAQSMVVNPDSVERFAPSQLSPNPLHIPYQAPSMNPNLESFPYLIITTAELSHSLRRLAALKRQKGYNVKLVTVDDVRNDPYAQYGDIVNVNGVPTLTYDDAAGIIRQYLKLAYYYNRTKYLLLAGTAVPYRTKYSIDTDVPTDLYYSDLNANWMSDTIDKQPELYVGRILAKKVNQIDDYTDKLLRYELNPGKGDKSYLQYALYTESADMMNLSKGIGQWMSSICPDSTIIQERYGQKYPTASVVIDTINTVKYGFWSTFNHGSPSCIITYGMVWPVAYGHPRRIWAIDSVHITNSNYGAHSTDSGLNRMDNKDQPMISYSISCTTMPFDVYSSTYIDLPMNFGESFTTGKNFGGPAYLGNTRDGYIIPSSVLAGIFGRQLHDGYFKIGEAEALSKAHFKSLDANFNYYIPITHNLLGDPVLEMWSDTPQLYSSINITRTDNSVAITGIDSDSTIVAYYSNDGSIGTDTISTTSAILSGISPNSTIMLYKHNHIPYIAPLKLQNITFGNNQYVIASDVSAGYGIDNNRTSGNVIVPAGIDYEIESSGKVELQDGFKVEKGAFFAVYPSCF